MTHLGHDVAKTILSMSSDEFHSLIRDAVRDRRLHSVVQTLNAQAMSKSHESASHARAALSRIGFSD